MRRPKGIDSTKIFAKIALSVVLAIISYRAYLLVNPVTQPSPQNPLITQVINSETMPATEKISHSISLKFSRRKSGKKAVSLSPLEEFHEAVSKASHSIPSLEELSRLPDRDVHSTPTQLIHAGAGLGRVMDIIEKNPELKAEGIRFFETCLRTEHFPNSVKALCYQNIKELNPQHATDMHVPDEVLNIANF